MWTDPAGTVPNRFFRYFYSLRVFAGALPLLSALLTACGGDSSDGPLVNNAYGGASRSNNYSSVSISTVSSFSETSLDSLRAGFIGPPLPVAGDRLAAVIGERQLAVIRYDQPEWIYRFDEGEYPLPELASDSVGRIYVGTTTRSLCALENGKLLWRQPIGVGTDDLDVPTWPLVIPGGVIGGTTSGLLKRFDFAGKENWNVRFGANIVRATAFDPGLGIVVGVTHNDYARSDTVVLLDEGGKRKWAAPLQNLRIEYGPIVVGEGVVIGAAGRDTSGKYTPFLLALDKSGKERWRASLNVLPLGIAADDDGNLYVCGGGGSQMSGGIIASFDATGKFRWQVSLSESVPSIPAILSDRICFIAIRERTLGLYMYNRDGAFVDFTSIESLTEIIPIPVVLPYGVIVLAGSDKPAILKGR